MRYDKSAVEALRFQITELETQLANLKTSLAEAEASVDTFADLDADLCNPHVVQTHEAASKPADYEKWPLDPEEFKRYGRQIIMPEIGLRG